MAADHNVLDLDVLDRELDDAQQAQVGGVDDVGDVAVGEDIAGLEAEDGGLGFARIGAAEPEDLGRLAFGEGGEEFGVGVGGFFGPFVVVLEAQLPRVVACGRTD